MPWSSKLKKLWPRIAVSRRARIIGGATSNDVPIAGSRVHGVTATGSSTTGDWPRRHGAFIAGRYGAVGATRARGFVITAPLGRRTSASAAITAAFAA